MAKMKSENTAELEKLSRNRREEEAKNSEQFELLGRYVAVFEGVYEQVRTLILVVQQRYGLQNDEVSDAITIGLGAHELNTRFSTISKIWFKEHPNDLAERLSEDCQKRLKVVIKDRNHLVHGFWFNTNPQSRDECLGTKLVHTAKGIEIRPLPSTSELDIKTEEVYLLLHIIFYLCEYIRTQDESILTENFDFGVQGIQAYRFTQK